MVAVPPDHVRLLPFLISVGAVGMAVVLAFGIGVLSLASRDPAVSLGGRDPSVQAVEAHEVLAAANDTTPGSSAPTLLDDKAAGRPDFRMLSRQEPLVLREMAIETRLDAPQRVDRAKWLGARRHSHQRTASLWQTTATHWPALWRPDARVAPEPGGGFYHPKNFDVGHVNPER